MVAQYRQSEVLLVVAADQVNKLPFCPVPLRLILQDLSSKFARAMGVVIRAKRGRDEVTRAEPPEFGFELLSLEECADRLVEFQAIDSAGSETQLLRTDRT